MTEIVVNERDVYVLRFALARGQDEFEAHAVTSAEFREALASENEPVMRQHQRGNRSVGWGLTCSRLAKAGYLKRHVREGWGSWVYLLPSNLVEKAQNAVATWEAGRTSPGSAG